MKHTFWNFQYRECDEFTAYLNKMARRGYIFKDWDYALAFEKGEPQEIEYFVDVFPYESELNNGNSKTSAEYASYCEEAGWKFITSKRKFCIFQKLRNNAIPLVTEEERLINIKTATLKNWPIVYSVLILVFISYCNAKSLDIILTPIAQVLFILTGFQLLACVLRAVSTMFWYYKSKKKLEKGEKITYARRFGRQKRTSVGLICFMLLFIFSIARGGMMTLGTVFLFIFMCFVMLGIAMIVGSLKLNFLKSFILVTVISLGLCAIFIYYAIHETGQKAFSGRNADIGISSELLIKKGAEVESIQVKSEGNLLGKKTEYILNCRKNGGKVTEYFDVGITVYETKIDYLIREHMLKTYENMEKIEDIRLKWQAKEAYFDGFITIVRYDGKCIHMYGIENLNENQIEGLRLKLGLI